jgi:hypothetical protein
MRSGIGAACPFTFLLFREAAFFFVPVLLADELVVVVETFVAVLFALDFDAVVFAEELGLLLPLCAALVDGIVPPTAMAAATKPIQVALLNK